MPVRTLRFCRACLTTQQAFSSEHCTACGGLLAPLLDADGALSREFLTARRTCCNTGCRNCPYEKPTNATKTCDRCHAIFQCGGTACWCNSVALRPVTLEWLDRTYTDCLCPTCLADLSHR